MGLVPEEKLRGPLSRAAIKAKSMIRRFVVAASEGSLWNIEGFDKENDVDIPVFSGVGFSSRPRAAEDSDAECVVVKIGGKTAHPLIVATRDEALRQILVAIRDMLEDETAMFNSKARVHILADGTVEVDDGSGAVALALKSDLDSAKSVFDSHSHATTAVTGGGGPVGVISAPGSSFPTPVGTTILKGK